MRVMVPARLDRVSRWDRGIALYRQQHCTQYLTRHTPQAALDELSLYSYDHNGAKGRQGGISVSTTCSRRDPVRLGRREEELMAAMRGTRSSRTLFCL